MANYNLIEVKLAAGELTLAGLANTQSEPEVIALHGWLDNAASFAPLFEHAEFSMVALDWPGHGYSEHRKPGAHYHFVDYCYDLLSLFEENQWQAKHIVAHSMGAMVATLFAAAFPEKVKSVTLIDAVGIITLDDNKVVSQLREGLASRRLVSTSQTKYFSKETVVKARLKVSDLQLVHCQLIIDRNLKKQDNDQYSWRSDPRLRTVSPYRYNYSQAKQVMSELNVPAQLIYGDKGIALVQENLSLFSKEVSHLPVYKLVGGHHIHMEQSKKVVEYIQQFIYSTVVNP